MSLLGKPPRDLSVTDDPKDFERWLSHFENYINVVEISHTLTSEQKHALMLNCIGEDASRIISGFEYITETNPYENLTKALKQYFLPKENLTFERYQFRMLHQEDKILPFINELHNKAKRCDFSNTAIDSVYNQNVRDQLIIGIKSDDLRKRLLAINDLTLDKAINICTAYESSTDKVENIKSQNSQPSAGLLAIQSKNRTRSISPHERRPRSKSRGRVKSPSRNRNIQFTDSQNRNSEKFCKYCKKNNHTIENCFKLNNKNKSKNNSVFNITDESSSSLKRVTCNFYDSDLTALVDTGSSISLISRNVVRKLGLQAAVTKRNHSAILANGESIEFEASLQGPLLIDGTVIEAQFFVTNWLPNDLLLGMDVLGQFSSINLSDNGPQLLLSILPGTLSEYSSLFNKPISEACCKRQPDPIINLVDGSIPYQSKVRNYSKQDQLFLKEHIQTLLDQGIIKKSSSPWRHAPVIVPKKTGGFRMAIDYRPVNSMTKLDAFPIPNAQELLHRVENCKYFSSLDFSQFYYQLPLAESDQEKTAFYANGELYQFIRCPFGLKNAVSYCTRVMSDIFENLKGVAIYLDDVLIFAKSKAEHDQVLKEVLERIKSFHLSLNLKKCRLYQESVTFLGHKISNGQVSPDPDRTSPILKFPTPENVKQLQRFLGMANYFRNYIQNFARITSDL